MLNNSSNDTTGISSHEILYEFRVLESIDLLNNDKTKLKTENDNPATKIKNEKKIFRIETKNAINFEQTIQKIKYDSRHKSLNFNEKDKMYFRFHKDYNQPNLENRKFDKQKIGSIKILNKMNKLIYRLDISFTWKIHSVVSIAHLKSASNENDFYHRKFTESDSIETKKKCLRCI